MKEKEKQLLFCTTCGWKAFVDTINLTEVKTAPFQKSIKNQTLQQQLKKYKCPACGRLIIVNETKN